MVSRIALAAIVVVAIVVALVAIVFSGQFGNQPSLKTTDVQFQPAGTCKGSADCITGTVTRVVDGDTLDIDNTRIRLTLVNTPEVNQAGYEEAKQFTSKLCPVGSRAVADEDDGQTGGSYGRVIAKVTCDGGKVLNEELLKAHMAEILTDFCGMSEFRNEGWAATYGC